MFGTTKRLSSSSKIHEAKCKLQSQYKFHLNMIRNGELSDPLCDSVNRGLTLVRLLCVVRNQEIITFFR